LKSSGKTASSTADSRAARKSSSARARLAGTSRSSELIWTEATAIFTAVHLAITIEDEQRFFLDRLNLGTRSSALQFSHPDRSDKLAKDKDILDAISYIISNSDTLTMTLSLAN
jgi:hypothetical protein